MPKRLLLLVAGCALAALAAFYLRTPSAPSAASVPSSVAAPTPTATLALPPDEIFRRAFWRQPAPGDHILHAERREWTADPASAEPAAGTTSTTPSLTSTSTPPVAATTTAAPVQRWQWFLALHPSAELLRALRDPETFGLVATATPRPWIDSASDHAPAPAWFPLPLPLLPTPGPTSTPAPIVAPTAAAEFEILQTPSARLTLLYRARDNTLFATDAGLGFAPPVTRAATR